MHQFAELPPFRSVIADHADARMKVLLRHKYFEACKNKSFTRPQLIEIVKQLYCFSVYFERIITQRVATYRSRNNGSILRLARQHLKEEIGHADLFRSCLLNNGLTQEDVDTLMPKMFTKAMFGYLMATITYDNEFTSNIAIMQVMETIGYHFFGHTLQMMQHYKLSDVAFVAHTADDEHHAKLGLDLYKEMTREEITEAIRVMDDCFELMGHVFTEWMG